MGGITVHELLLTSQKWREYTWTHQLTVLQPAQVAHDGALLWITGGSTKDGQPKWSPQSDSETLILALLALRNEAVVGILRQVPNQPLYGNLSEDALISYTLSEFKNDGDYSWPLLFPMVKSAVRAMDAMQEFSEANAPTRINRFVVSGASKRGWTTWLTGAVDPRVVAMAPAVIDMLNMPVSLDYHLEVWGQYSPQIQDYVRLGIPQDVHTGVGEALVKMIDPYSYRARLTMPKMIFIGTNDPYWPVDAIKHYIDSIPGNNYIHYEPNAGHDLGGSEDALWALSAFLGNTLAGGSYPACAWEVHETAGAARLTVSATAGLLSEAYLWIANSEDRDFRDAVWQSTDLEAGGQALVETDVAYPPSGYRAFYIDLEYADPVGGTYTQSTRMFVCSRSKLFLN
jgi:PhoPQ-activated pathogenicity-related protein